MFEFLFLIYNFLGCFVFEKFLIYKKTESVKISIEEKELRTGNRQVNLIYKVTV